MQALLHALFEGSTLEVLGSAPESTTQPADHIYERLFCGMPGLALPLPQSFEQPVWKVAYAWLLLSSPCGATHHLAWTPRPLHVHPHHHTPPPPLQTSTNISIATATKAHMTPQHIH